MDSSIFVLLQIEYGNTANKPLKILHLTDIHITPDYQVNSVSTCGFPLCCKQGLASDLHEAVGRVRAGKWGDYKCDVPLWMFANMIQHIKEFHPVSFLISKALYMIIIISTFRTLT